MKRKQLNKKAIDCAVNDFRKMLEYRLKEKGRGTFASKHEILGVVTAELQELTDAVEHKFVEDVRHELLDVAVGCVFGVACIDKGTLDW